MPKILVIRFSSIGDIVLTTPVFRCLKKQLPGAAVHFVTKASYRIVTEHNPYIDKFFYLEDDLQMLIKELREEQYDYIIDLHNNARSYRIKRALKKKSFSVDKLNVQKFLLTNLNINIMPDAHITKRSLDTVASLGVKDDGEGLDYFIPKNDIVQQHDIPTSHSAGFISVVIGATYNTKKLPIHKLKELCEKICSLQSAIDKLESMVKEAHHEESGDHEAENLNRARFFEQKVIPAMNAVRAFADELELIVDDSLWPLPKFREMLYVY